MGLPKGSITDLTESHQKIKTIGELNVLNEIKF